MQIISSHPFFDKIKCPWTVKIKPTALRIHKNKHNLQTERNNTIVSKKSRGRQKYVQNIQKGTRHGKQLIERKILHMKRNIVYF